MKSLLPIATFGLFLYTSASLAQGCLAIRPMGGMNNFMSNQFGLLNQGEWLVSANYQYFKSFRHYRGAIEEHERIELGTQVINKAHSTDFGLTYAITNRINLRFNLPVLSYDRSSLYEHYGNSLTSNPDQLRFHTNSFGIGDLRIAANYWLIDPGKIDAKGNVSLGLGLKLPTGNSNVQGDFHKLSSSGNDSIVRRALDQSIQLGDKGWGLILTGQGVRKIGEKSLLYANAFYMITPQETNQTLTRGTLVGTDPIIAYHSIADQYTLRAGLIVAVLPNQNLSASLGMRFEGVTAHDLIGGSNGFRRPGYVLSVDPGISYATEQFNLNVNVPFALYRNRIKSVQDLADPLGVKHGDAAFADYLISFSIAYKLGGYKHNTMKDSHE